MLFQLASSGVREIPRSRFEVALNERMVNS